MKTKLKQIFYDMSHQRVVTWVTLTGTALTMFLIIGVIIIEQVGVIPFAPESCRPRLMVGANIDMRSLDGESSSSGSMSNTTARRLYGALDGVEVTSYMTEPSTENVKGETGKAFEASHRRTDAAFWRLFDHTLTDGRFYTDDEGQSKTRVAVITESTARNLFGGVREALGSTFMLDHLNWRVIGVVKDHSKMATTASADIFTPLGPDDPSSWWGELSPYYGEVRVALRLADGVSYDHIREQVKARYAALATEVRPTGFQPEYHEGPYDQETIATCDIGWSNVTPDRSKNKRIYTAIYVLLLLVPAINLSAMLQSRLRRRVSELGVRRAFGCTRARIISDIISENLIVTSMGALTGFVLAIAVLSVYPGVLDTVYQTGDATPPLSTMLNWRVILAAFAGCFLLNLISAAVPAWHASRLSPVNAINQERQ